MSELDDFLTTTLARQVAAEEAMHNGNPDPRLAMWSTRDPVTLFGAMDRAGRRASVLPLARVALLHLHRLSL